MIKTTPEHLDLLALFDEIAKEQPDTLTALLEEVGVPREAIGLALVDLGVALAGMRRGIAQGHIQLERRVRNEQAQRLAQSSARLARELEDDLATRLRNQPQAERQAKQKGRQPPSKINEREERTVNAAKVEQLEVDLRRRAEQETTPIKNTFTTVITDVVNHVAQPYLDRYNHAAKRIAGWLTDWNRVYDEKISKLDAVAPETVAVMLDRAPTDYNTYVLEPQADGTFIPRYSFRGDTQ